ncbi:non-ribosomal peptide synthetase [Chryseolinea lacunae]|uniref:Amino acid adenylation domain-containing protein n=1 Tax=Chryseolinea lacunae TaxID=2801331 RepID=A0ABS1KXP4_9BACT|nr:non-ribosomal peptide synthetase [Chryseolinea lacunae]MBL0743076.1 amino acid adenylation domain-containing protein [Chryseolinea lacunae]
MNAVVNGYSLSPLQRRIWMQKHAGYDFNNILCIKVCGALDLSRLSAVLQGVANRHEIFRTSYIDQADLAYPMQIVEGDCIPFNPDEDVVHLDADMRKPCVARILEELLVEKFAPDQSTMLRARVLTFGSAKHLLVLYASTLASDAATLCALADEVQTAYGNDLEQHDDAGEQLQFIQYSEWHNEMLDEANEEASQFWQQQVATLDVFEKHPFQHYDHTKEHELPQHVNVELDRKVKQQLNNFLEASGQNASDFLLTCWSVLLYHHLATPGSFVMGKVESGRTFEGFQKISGVLARTLPMRCAFNASDTFGQVYQKLTTQAEVLRQWQDNYNPVPERASEKNYLSVSFESVAAGANATEQLPVAFTVQALHTYNERFNAKLLVWHRGSDLKISLHYQPAFFTHQAIALWKEQLTQLIGRVLSNAHEPIGKLMKVGIEEQHLLLNDFNATETRNNVLPFVRLFEDQVRQTPGNIAFHAGDVVLTYGELDRRSNQFANLLIEQHRVKPGDVVALRMKRGVEMFVALLGIMKAGATFLPIDRGVPAERCKFMLDDSGAVAVIADEFVSVDGLQTPIILFDERLVLSGSNKNPDINLRLADNVYIIYTSGSTGQPKGTIISQHSFANYIRWFKTIGGITAADSTLLLASIAFDLCYTSLWPALASGSTVHILEQADHLDPDRLIDTLTSHKVTFLKLTPSQFSFITDDVNFDATSKHYALRLIVLGGEHIKTKDVGKFLDAQPATKFLNHYGPTETTIGTASYYVTRENFDHFEQRPVIGKPIHNNKAYIVDGDLQLCPVGVAGEICISGAGVSKGYLNRKTLMDEKFVDNPFAPGTVLYKTGDVGRWLADGSIQLAGRNDGQVKIRGYRVELAEIEKIILQHSAAKNAVVLLHDDTPENTYLTAYVETKTAIDVATLRNTLSQKLPDYMMPANFIIVDSFPLLAHGKINRAALLAMKTQKTDESTHELPKNRTEEQLLELWQRILQREQISTSDNFLSIGGNSLKLVKVFREVSQLFPGQVVLADLFKYSTIQTLARYLTRNELVNNTIDSFEF